MRVRKFITLFLVVTFLTGLLALPAMARPIPQAATSERVAAPAIAGGEAAALTDGELGGVNSLAGSTVSMLPDDAWYLAGLTRTICLEAANNSPDEEWIAEVNLTLPAGWTAACNTQDPGPLLDCSAAGNAISYTDTDGGFGEILDGEIWGFCLDATPPGDASGTQTWNWELVGDVWGEEPHVVTGSIELDEAETGVLVTPDEQAGEDFAGESVSYDLIAINLTGSAATLYIAIDSDWPVTAPAATSLLPDGAAEQFTVVVDIPSGGYVLDQDVATVTVSGGGYEDHAVLTTTHAIDRWVFVAPLPAASTRLAVAGDGTYLFAQGGQGAVAGNELYRYNPGANAWTALDNAPDLRSNHEICAMDGHLYSAMGYAGSAPFDSGFWDYDIAAETWSTLASVPGTARLWAPHVCAPDQGAAGRVYVLGGYDGGGGVSTVNVYDVDSGAWSLLTELPVPTYGADAALLGDSIYVKLGGSNDVYSYDLSQGAAGVWAAEPAALSNPGLYMVSVVNDNVWYLAGNGFGGDFDAAERYLPSAGSWQQIARLNDGRFHTNGGLADGAVYAVGGTAADGGTILDSVERYEREAGVVDATLSGTVTAFNAPAVPIPFAQVSVEPGGFFAETDADGAYRLLVPGRPYTVTVSAAGFATGAALVDLTSGDAVQDFELASPAIEFAPAALAAKLIPDGSVTQTLVISNTGTELNLDFDLFELPGAARSVSTQLMQPRYPTLVGGPLVVDAELDARLADGQTGDFYVWLRERADLTPAYRMADRDARRIWVYQTLRDTAERSQVELRRLLDGLGYSYEVVWLNNSILVHDGDSGLVARLSERSDVYRLRGVYSQMSIPDAGQRLVIDAPAATQAGSDPSWSVRIIEADRVWEALGFDGAGAVVANIDTGVQYTHPALVDNYRGNLGSGLFDHSYNWFAPTISATNPAQCGIAYDSALEPCDSNGHGSHTMGTMVGGDGSGPFDMDIGVAPGAEWMACMGCDDYYPGGAETCNDLALTRCAEWVMAPTEATSYTVGLVGDPTKAPDVVNNSWGDDGGDDWYYSYVQAWRAADIIPVFSAGNSGPACGTLGSPGDMDNVIGVGGTDDQNRNYSYSSRGPGLGTGVFPLQKPDVAAPGESVISSVPDDTYAIYSGTSMAAPHAAGLVALLRGIDPSLSFGEIYDLLTTTAFQELSIKNGDLDGCGLYPAYPNYVFGYGRIDAYQAARALLAGQDIPWFSVDPLQGSIPPGGQVQIDALFDCSAVPAGWYAGSLLVDHNDPLSGMQTISLRLACVLDVYIPALLK